MLEVLGMMALHALLLSVAVTTGAVASRRFVRDGALLAGCGLVVAGILAYLTGVVWFGSPTVGLWVSRGVPVASIVYLAWVVLLDRASAVRAMRSVAVPVVLSVLWATLSLGMGFLAGGYDQAADVASTRFSWRLPIDNQLPYLFARHVELNAHSVPPPVGDWLSSDRPPLQSAFVLAQTLWHRGDASALLDYQVLSALLQSTWVIGVWTLAAALGMRRPVRALVIGGCASLGVVLANTFYVWPKLLAAAFVLSAAGFVFHRADTSHVSRLGFAATAGALAYLAHGGAVFALIPIALVAVWQLVTKPRAGRTVVAAFVGAAPLVGSWMAYQRWLDPPGDRLLKWMLADVLDVDPRGTLTAIADRYGEVGFGGAVSNKVENVAQVLGLPVHLPAASTPWLGVVSYLRGIWFFDLIPSLGLLLLLTLGWCWWRRAPREHVRTALALWAVWLSGLAVWCLLMFGPRTTVTHQGTYALVLLGVAALVATGALVSTRWTLVVVALQAAVTLLVYTPLLPVADAGWTQGTGLAKQALLVLLLGSVGFVGVLVWDGLELDRRAAGSFRARPGMRPAFVGVGGSND